MVAVIEDNVYNLEIIKQMFAYTNIEVSYFVNGESFINVISDEKFDLIFLDIELPDMTGFDILKKIRQIEKLNITSKKAFVIALTAHSEGEYINKCMTNGFDSYMTKPFKMKELLLEIKKAGLNLSEYSYENNYEIDGVSEEEEITSINSNELRTILLEVFDTDFNQMKDAFLKKDIKIIKYYAHKLKGSFSLAGEKVLADVFSDLELCPENFNIKTIKKIENHMNQTRTEIYKQN